MTPYLRQMPLGIATKIDPEKDKVLLTKIKGTINTKVIMMKSLPSNKTQEPPGSTN